MPYVAPSSTAASSSSSDIIARIRKGSVGQASASSSSQDAGTNGKDGIVDGNQRRKESEDITAQDDQDESMTHPQPRSFLQVVDDEPTPRPETVKSSPLDRSLDVPATSANTDNSDSDHLSAQLENTVLADQPLATSPGDLPASEPGFTELQPESQSQSQDHERGNSNNSNSTASTSSSVSTYETETEGEGYSTSEYASGSGPDTPATATSVDTSGGGGRVVRGVKGFHAWELTEELMRYKNELYNYTHGLYLQAKLSTATDTKSRANSDGKDKVPKDKEGKKSAAYSQFGLRQSGMEKLAAKKALAKALNAC